MSPSRQGFTLVEMLVVMAIIALLVAILLPAIQAARESGRRTACGNNLGQLALAVHTHQEARNHMPAYYGTDAYIPSKSSWYVFLLPYMEQMSLYREMRGPDGEERESLPKGSDCVSAVGGTWVAEQVLRNKPGTGGSAPDPRPGFEWTQSVPPEQEWVTLEEPKRYENRTSPVAGTKGKWDPEPKESTGNCGGSRRTGFSGKFVALDMAFDVLFCPSDPNTSETHLNPRHAESYNKTQLGNMSLSNYQANFHAFTRGKVASWSGSPKTEPARLDAISRMDGLSNTLFFAEGHRICGKYGGSAYYGVRFSFWSDRYHHAFGMNWHGEPNTFMFQSNPLMQDCNSWRVQSMHGSSLMVAFGDGSVRPISDKVSRAEQSDPNDVSPGAQIVMGPDYGTWDRLMLPFDGKSPGLSD